MLFDKKVYKVNMTLSLFEISTKFSKIFRVYDLLGGRFPSDYVLPNLKIPALVMIGGMDRFCGDPKYFESVIVNCRFIFQRFI